MEETFLNKLKAIRNATHTNQVSISKEKYKKIIMRIRRAKVREKRQPADYNVLKKYDVVIDEHGSERLIVSSTKDSHLIYYVCDEEIFDILSSVHEATGHGGRDRMMKLIRQKYKNITYKDINLFLNLCERCLSRQKRERRVASKTFQFDADLVQSNQQQDICPNASFTEELSAERKCSLMAAECTILSQLCSDISMETFSDRLAVIKKLARLWAEGNERSAEKIVCEKNDVDPFAFIKREQPDEGEDVDREGNVSSGLVNCVGAKEVDFNSVPLIIVDSLSYSKFDL